jgi:hypothetical protein
MSFEIIVSQVCSFIVYIGMISSKQRMINEKDELDDELQMTTIVLIGQYRKRMQMKHIGIMVQFLDMRFMIGVV